MSNNNRFYHDEHVFLDLERVIVISGDGTPDTVLILFKQDGKVYLTHPRPQDLIAAMVAYTSPPPLPPPPAQDPRVANTPWLSERQKASISSVIASFGPTVNGHPIPLVPNPLKPGVVYNPEARINQGREAGEVMRPLQVGHGPETSSSNIVAPDSNTSGGEEEEGTDTVIEIP